MIVKKSVLVVFIILMFTGIGMAQNEEEGRVVERHGVGHYIADDRKVVKVGGIYEAEGLDIYLGRRIGVVEDELRELRSSIEEMKRTIDEIKQSVKLLTSRNQ